MNTQETTKRSPLDERLERIEELTTRERMILNGIDHGIEIGAGASANVFAISEHHVVKAIDRTRTILNINALEKELGIQNEAWNTITLSQDEIPNISVPKPVIAIPGSERGENEHRDYLVMKRVDGIPLHLLIVREYFTNTQEGQRVFLEAIHVDRRLNTIRKPTDLNEAEAWGIIVEYHPKFKEFQEKRNIDEFSHKKFLQDTRSQMFTYLVDALKKTTQGKSGGSPITFPGTDQTITPSHTQQMRRAIQLLHKQGIAHRDLGPWNILLGKDGNLHIIDFGIAHQKDDLTNRALSLDELQRAYTMEYGDERFGDLFFVRDEDIVNILKNLEAQEHHQRYEDELTEKYDLKPKTSIIRKRLGEETLRQWLVDLEPELQGAAQRHTTLDHALTTTPLAKHPKWKGLRSALSEKNSPLYLEALLVLKELHPSCAKMMILLETEQKPSQMTLQRHHELQRLAQEYKTLDIDTTP